jgi:hypothetical protein
MLVLCVCVVDQVARSRSVGDQSTQKICTANVTEEISRSIRSHAVLRGCDQQSAISLYSQAHACLVGQPGKRVSDGHKRHLPTLTIFLTSASFRGFSLSYILQPRTKACFITSATINLTMAVAAVVASTSWTPPSTAVLHLPAPPVSTVARATVAEGAFGCLTNFSYSEPVDDVGERPVLEPGEFPGRDEGEEEVFAKDGAFAVAHCGLVECISRSD